MGRRKRSGVEAGDGQVLPQEPVRVVPGGFQKGGDPRQYQHMKPEVLSRRQEGDGVGLLKVLRTVLLNKSSQDEGEEEKAARRWLEKNEREFLNRKEELEAEERAAADSSRAAAGQVSAKLAEVGPDERRVRELIGSLLAEMTS